MKLAAFLAPLGLRSRSLRIRLVALVAAALVPALVFDGWLTLQSARSERTLLERNADNKVKEVTADIDHEIASAKAMLIALASSQFLQTQDFERFHQQSTEVAKQLGIQIVLRDVSTGQQIVNAALPWGQPLPQTIPAESVDAMREALESGKPSISNVFYGSVVGQSLITVGIPVARGGANAYYLLVAIPLDVFAAALSNAALPGQWTITLIDRANTIIARSERHSQYVGTKVKFDFKDEGTAEGVNIGASRYGEDIRWTWRRSSTTGWIVSVGVPLSLLEAPKKSALINYAMASSGLLALSLALTYFLSGYLPRSIGALGIDRTPTREEFRILFESAPNGVLVVDDKRRIVLANERIDEKFGYGRGELTGRPVDVLFPERFRDTSTGGGTAAIVRVKPAAGADRSLCGRRKDGAEFPIEILLNPIAPRAGRFEIVTIIDTTAREQAAARLSAAVAERDELRRRLMQAQEDERLRLARELHDQTGQTLTAAMLELKGLEIQYNEAGRHRIRTLRERMEEIGKSLHRIARELRPASIDELGLNTALANYVSEWSQQFGIPADFLRGGDVDLDTLTDEKRTAIYRVVQEALTNIAKHAREATSVSVVVGRTGSTVQLTIEDNGRGFDVAAMTGSATGKGRRGLGVAGMRERLALIGGELEIESSIGVGTTVFARIPADIARLTA